jgi:hypothetical protein
MGVDVVLIRADFHLYGPGDQRPAEALAAGCSQGAGRWRPPQ